MESNQAAAELLDLRRTGRVIAGLAPELVPSDLAAAYAVQDQVVAGLLADGGTTASSGYKCACTSVIAQEALTIDRPVFGRLLPHTSSPSGSTLNTNRFTHRVIEAEYGFRLGRDVPAGTGPHTAETISEYIDAVIPSIEIVDYRFESWTVGALQVAADNAIHGWWVESDPIEDWRGLDLVAAPVSVSQNGEPVTTGSGANVLGHPLTVMAWLADELISFGRQLQAGDKVTTGVTTDVFEAEAGDHIAAEFVGIGLTEVHFS